MDAKQDIKIFRAAVFPLSIAIAGPALLIILCLMLRLDGLRHLNWKSLLLGAVAIECAGIICAWVISVCFPDKLAPTGVHGHSFWGVPQFIAWPAIAKATPFRYLTFRFLRLHPADGKGATWVALSQSRQKEFEAEIRKLSPPDCPMRAYLH